MHPSNKHLVLDGRSRSGTPTDQDVTDGVAAFSFFWSVERTDAPELANLQLEYPTLEVAASVTLPGKKAAVVDAKPAQVLVPPVLTNGKAIHTHVRLLAMHDLNLQNITNHLVHKRVAAAVEGRASKRPNTSE
jgi:hypothetical protein